MNRTPEAERIFQVIVQSYADSDIARQAEARLRETSGS